MTDHENLLQRLTGELLVTGRQWRRLTAQIIGKHGVSEAAAAPLIWIGRLDNVRQTTLAEHIGVETASLVRLIDQLTEAGLVTRTPDATDRRANILNLTDAGRAAVAPMEAGLKDLRRRVLKDVSEPDIEAALRVFAAIRNASAQ